MPCVSVSHNRARKAIVKATNPEYKSNRKATRLAKKQQFAAKRAAKSEQKAIKRAVKARKILEARVTKKHQARVARTKKTSRTQARQAVNPSPKTRKSPLTSLKKLKTPRSPKPLKNLKSALKTAKKPAASSPSVLSESSEPKTAPATRISKITDDDAKTVFKVPHASSSRAAHSVDPASTTAKLTPDAQSVFELPLSPSLLQAPFQPPANQPKAPQLKPIRRTPYMTRADLINAESSLGSTIFGPIPVGHRREFFHDKQNIWIWYESWRDVSHHTHQLTVRYEVRTSGVYKKVSAGSYYKLSGAELENFRRATHAYLNVIKKYLYSTRAAA